MAALDQILVHGLCHVNLHPGNLLIQDDGAVGLLDLGSVGRLDSTTRLAIGRLLAALERTDSLADCGLIVSVVLVLRVLVVIFRRDSPSP